MRTIEAPGVEWNEIDLSQNTPTITGTVSLVMGFAAKGEDEKPVQPTGASSWQTFFGQPSNEAERYFYAACMKVLNQNGSLIAAKIPYRNKSKGKFIAIDYALSELGDYTSFNPEGDLSNDIDYFFKDVYDSANTMVTSIVTSYQQGDDGQQTLVSSEVSTKVGIDQHFTKAYNFTNGRGAVKISEDALNIYRVGQMPEFTETDAGDETLTNEQIPIGTFRIVDITRSTLEKDALDQQTIGIFPVIIGCGNTIPTQNILENDCANSLNRLINYQIPAIQGNGAGRINGYQTYCPILQARNHVYVPGGDDAEAAKVGPDIFSTDEATPVDLTNNEIFTGGNVDVNSAQLFSGDRDTASLSKDLMSMFPTITVQEDGSVDREFLGKLMVAVIRAYVDPLCANKVNYQVMETYVGSPWKDAIDKTTGTSIYLGDLINGTSNYIEFYANMEGTDNSRQQNLNDLYFVNFGTPTSDQSSNENNGKFAVLTPFTINESKKYCSFAQIMQSIQSIFAQLSNINAVQIDLVVDAGLSNISQFVSSNHSPVAATESGYTDDAAINFYDPIKVTWKLQSRNDTLAWRSIYSLYNTFCQTTRKDCMFILDGLRPFCLEGSQKIIRNTKPSNTIDKDILPKLNFMAGLNTSYGCGEVTWDYIADDFTGAFFWRPPSIARTGAIIYTDNTANYWDAPAGLTRGIVSDATDIAFNPSNVQAGQIYKKGWNYMINWPADGITVEGQKTLQVKSSAFDRINVRRLFLRLERAVYQAARYFVYELNTATTRQRFLDTVDPLFSTAKIGGGIYDYRLLCDETNNTPTVIDANEMVFDAAIKPSRAAEFIICNFYALRTDGSWSEAGM